ncbi:MAG TPA: TAT-variant-translocated molybdopterin oxidoreductase [Gemmataceae bacterium]|jgi:molybdopterin-containing oxidoreductase family iron-sulfur binding subunit|nr:TAT-variant-translocated molybdopterin oxidoreductase [Gemmataceae bacterium]
MSSLNVKQNGVPLDLDAARRQIAEVRGQSYWRSLEELAGHPQFEELLHREFPVQADEWANPVTRRTFLSLMGASLALAGLAGCSQPPPEKILPYIRQPEDIVPGKPLFFASAMPLAGIGAGVLVESHMGRPTKIEGNPDHPASLGATDVFTQASILNLYDPDRETGVTYLGRPSTWNEALAALRTSLHAKAAEHGRGFCILTEAISSPSQVPLLERLLRDFSEVRWHQYEPTTGDGVLEGAKLAFGKPVLPIYHVGKADVILALDSDFLNMGPGSVRYAREFSERRKPKPGGEGLNRLYAVESSPSTTGSQADHRLPARSGEIESLARFLAIKLGIEGIDSPSTIVSKNQRWIEAVARDLKDRKPGTTLVVAGDSQPAVVHALVHSMNEALGNQDRTVTYIAPVTARPENRIDSLHELADGMNAGKVDTLLILGGNPVYSAPGVRFANAMGKVRLRVHLGMYADETSEQCHWHIPEAHYLECWSDIRAFDGTATIGQPLIAPLFGAKSPLELLSGLIEETPSGSYEIVRTTWRRWHTDQKVSGDFEQFWRRSVHGGIIAGTKAPVEAVRLTPGMGQRLQAPATVRPDLEIVFKPDPGVFDGRFANNGWLQEFPRPLTKLTWDNAACVSPKTAQSLGLSYAFGATAGEHGRAYADIVSMEIHGKTLELPIWIMPGHADDSVTVHMGFGRTRAGRVGDNVGGKAAILQTSTNFWFAGGVQIAKVGRKHLLACVQGHHNMEGRELIRGATVAEFTKDPDFATKPDEEPKPHEQDAAHEEPNGRRPLSMFPAYPYEGYKWGMVIDLGACTGCSACVVACQAENNIPVVGKEEVSRGREMHWIRVDRYYQGDPFQFPDKLITKHQPIPCMQCENAPCEQVCPVAATSHSQDGLNDMVYNRCVGTRYCSNNCPYKVRRFNFLQYADFTTPSLRLLFNPEVTVRSRGVMEKCTYCVQRIRSAEIEAEKQQRRIRDGDVVTACQAACPAQAILFGDMNDPKSKIAQAKKSPLNYSLLHELNTQPRTTYLAAVRNPNPELA